MAKHIQVRCCCDPGKLLGYLALDDRVDLYPGARLVFRTTSPPPVFGVPAAQQLETGRSRVELTVAVLQEGENQTLAVKSNDTPIEILRQVAAFTEAGR